MSQLRDLAKPFPQRFVRDNPSGYGSYVPHHIYTQRLLMHCGPFEQTIVRELYGEVVGKPELGRVLVGVVLRITPTIDGAKVPVEEIGDCESPGNWSNDGARGKDAVSDALKRCCARFGLGTHLYAKTPEEYVLSAVLREREQFAAGSAPVVAGSSDGNSTTGRTVPAGSEEASPSGVAPVPPEISGVGDDVAVSNGGTDSRDSVGDAGAPTLEDDGRPFE